MFPNPDDDGDSWPPNPSAGPNPNFDPGSLPAGITVEELRGVRLRWGHMFHPSVVNKEGLSRLNLAQLLPYPEKPRLNGVLVAVVGHDPEVFAEHNEMVR